MLQLYRYRTSTVLVPVARYQLVQYVQPKQYVVIQGQRPHLGLSQYRDRDAYDYVDIVNSGDCIIFS